MIRPVFRFHMVFSRDVSRVALIDMALAGNVGAVQYLLVFDRRRLLSDGSLFYQSSYGSLLFPALQSPRERMIWCCSLGLQCRMY